MHIVTLSFDDGLKQSSLATARIYEQFGLSACFNVVCLRQEWSPPGGDPWPGVRGSFATWNELQSRGHEVMPHGCRHANKAAMPFAEAKDLIMRCLDTFAAELDGFDPARTIFNFPYNRTTRELEAWLPSVVRAYRCLGPKVNPLPRPGLVRLTTSGQGPGNCEGHLMTALDDLLARPSGWLVYNAHGLDREGWGPMRATFLEQLLAWLVTVPTVRVLPAARVLSSALDLDEASSGPEWPGRGERASSLDA